MSKFLQVRLGDVCRVINGRAYSQDELLNEGKYKVLRVGNFFSNGSWYYSDLELDEDKYCRNEDLLFAWSASFGPKIWSGEKTIYHYHIWKMVVDSSKLNKFFLYYYLKNVTQTLLGSTHGSIMLHLTKSYMEDLILNLPQSVKEQEQIASILTVIDSKIEINNKVNAELEAMAKTIYNYWFVQFDFPNAKGKPYKSSGGKMVWNEELKREIPEGWLDGTTTNIAELVRGVSYNKQEIKTQNDHNTIPILRATNITGNVIDLNDMVFIPNNLVDKKQLLNKYDILITMSSGSIEHIGKNGFYYFDETVSFGTFCSKLVAKDKYRYYLYSYLQSDFVSKTIKNECLGTNINNLNSSMINNFKVVLPDKKTIENFNSKISPIFDKIANNQQQNRYLISLRDWLLPMLMNGQVKIADTQDEQLPIAAEEDIEYNIGLNIPNNKKPFAKQVLGAKIVSLYKNDPHFTQIKFQKLQFLAEHVIQADLNLNYYFQAAGPYDNRFMHTINDSLKKSKWFDYKNHKYVPLDKQSQINEYYNGYFKPVTNKLERLFSLLQNATEAEAEIIATIYAVWNNRLIQSLSISDDLLIEDFYKWSKRKQQYTQEQILTGLNWLRTNDFKPTGFGKLIKQAKK